MGRMHWFAAVPPLAILLAMPGEVRAQEDGVSVDRVLFGQSAAFSGPTGELGKEFRAGVLAAFGETNDSGGVHGRTLELLSVDDSYEPEAAIANTRRLIEQERVFALIGAVGTPTSQAATPIAAEAGVPYIAPYSGAGFLRDEKQWPNVVNLRASYSQETAEIVERLISDLNIRRIAVIYQDDSYGRAGLDGVQRALNARGLSEAAVGTYTRNTTAVKTAVLELRAAQPGAVILVGAYKPVSAAITWARHIGLNPVFVTISFSGGNALAAELNRFGQGDVYVSQVVPFPSSQSSIARSYRRAMARHARNVPPGFVSFEGYLAGRLAVVGLQRSGEAVDRVRFLNNLLRGEPISLQGFGLRFGEGDNQGSNQVFLTVIGEDGQYSPITTLGGEF